MVVRKMPCLRSQTRGSSCYTTSSESSEVKLSERSAVQPTMSSAAISKPKPSKSTAFPFPSVVSVSNVCSKVKSPSIINITNASSEASVSSDISLVSVQSAANSSDESSEKSEVLDTAMLQASRHHEATCVPTQVDSTQAFNNFDPNIALPSAEFSNIRQLELARPRVYQESWISAFHCLESFNPPLRQGACHAHHNFHSPSN